MGFHAGHWAGPYKVLKLLGRGTFGEVFLANDPRPPQRRVALKTVSCDRLTEDAAERVKDSALKEAQLLQRLQHPNIVRCDEVQFDKERSVVWFALEFMDGGDAQSLIDARRHSGGPPFEAHFVRKVLASVGSALKYIHSEGVLHRDVKPANVLLTRRSQWIKLGDFGISKLLEATACARTVVGTPFYLSPEMVSGHHYGPAADAWALGVCLFELAALRRPFEAANPLALVRRICEEPPVGLPPDVAPDIGNAILGLLDRDPLQRLSLTDALTVSDAIVSLVRATPSTEQSVEPPHIATCNLDEVLTPMDPLSPVSMATTESGCGSGASDASSAVEIVASLCGMGTGGWQQRQNVVDPLYGWHRGDSPTDSAATTDTADFSIETADAYAGLPEHASEALAQARAALDADVDDPQELQSALIALQQEAPEGEDPWAETFAALCAELRARISMLRADAAALLQSLLDGPPQAARALWQGGENSERTVLEHHSADTVTTLCVGVSCSDAESLDMAQDVTALETAIEVATTLGVDTMYAEEQAATTRGLLSLRIVWGSLVRFCLMPLGVSYSSVIEEVAGRFGIPASSTGGRGGPLSFELSCRDRAEVVHIYDQSSWEGCLRSRGLHARPGRLELRLETVANMTPSQQRRARANAGGGAQCPFIVTGTRMPLAPRAHPASGSVGAAVGPTVRKQRRFGGGAARESTQPRILVNGAPLPDTATAIPAAVVAKGASQSGGWGVRSGTNSHPNVQSVLHLQLEGRSASRHSAASIGNQRSPKSQCTA